MKLDDYIKLLEDLKSKYGNVDVKVNETYECVNLSTNDTYSDPEEPYYNKDQKCIIVHSDFISFDYGDFVKSLVKVGTDN